MRKVVETPKPENPSSPVRFERVSLVGTGLRGWHYGQRQCEPHQQAEHMAAPTSNAEQAKSSCQIGAVHTWRESQPMWQARVPTAAQRISDAASHPLHFAF